jgi:hypothetical protein
MVINICGFHESRVRGGHTLAVDEYEITSAHVPISCTNFESRNIWVKPVYDITEYITCSLFKIVNKNIGGENMIA